MGSIGNVLDTTMSEKITDKVIQPSINEQHGFMEGMSTMTYLIIYSNHIANALEGYKQVDSIYLDFV